MPIQILPAILANQIAAGEVVERPASVIKELVENALDAGATQIDIEIEKGGHKRILVRDNGSGIAKDELSLALSRHATSKIASLDDLEQIISLGFRGEALASISSVARLSLSSKPKAQREAWRAFAEGRDMDVKLEPIAHPDGTSVDVLDLFFNTPARRKFLRTEKTEFSHIEEVIKRIALSRFDVAFTLKHNGKLIKKYPKITDEKNKFKRVSAVFGNSFSERAIQINSQYMQFNLFGWIVGPGGERNQNDLQYVYVNGRMMRDKLINHAIRQAFEGIIDSQLYPAYCLYLTLPPDEVDVNVHPAKHEVRFHEARMVHDFIYRVVNDVLQEQLQCSASEHERATIFDTPGAGITEDNPNERLGDFHSTPAQVKEVEPSHAYIKPLQHAPQDVLDAHNHNRHPLSESRQTGHHDNVGSSSSARHPSYASSHSTRAQMTPKHPRVDDKAVEGYYELMTDGVPPVTPRSTDYLVVGKWILFTQDNGVYAISLVEAKAHQIRADFMQNTPVSQPLLMPVSIHSDSSLLAHAQMLYEPLLNYSIEIGWAVNKILVRKVPAGYRNLPWAPILTELLTGTVNEGDLLTALTRTIAGNMNLLDQADSIVKSLFSEDSGNAQTTLKTLSKEVPLEIWLQQHAE
ncbi:DNA mismatch repair endonuclease MutL [Aestuariibacter sp. AA17]|uniref:DNA mismatch repair protein MutL n=1 Tax=Fluctibacter corallii TaxID=2984329 RepID=A0ABT3AD46_9ALTE|nr:DNA mismatch repair endonuclease MutL [Aestuariibacter sp. AA17]MCV2886596.1 DNA mismatch repair endonuclease MutL [Aestuariibacter sp. AA17]